MPSNRTVCSLHAPQSFRMSRLLSPMHAVTRLLVAMAAMSASSLAFAQPSAVKFDIVPVVAGAGVTRQISLSLGWPSGCLPTGATVVGSEIENARRRTLTIRLDGNFQDVLRCNDSLVVYRTTVTVKPDAEGDLRVLVVMNDGRYMGETTIRTRAANSDRSLVDLTGMWYDPATNGSGLTFIHSFAGNDVVFGTWFVYDALGAPRWYTIQGVKWSAGGLQADGQIYETRANSVVCPAPFTGCPVASDSITLQARARIVIQEPNSARIQAITMGGEVLFTSSIIRAVF